MNSGRFVVLGLAQARAEWFRTVAYWSTSGSAPIEFLKCVSADELRARLMSGRVFSAVLVDGSLPSVDRDLLDSARSAGCAVLVVDDVRVSRDWAALGAHAVLLPVFDRSDLLDALRQHAPVVERREADEQPAGEAGVAGWRGRVAMVCGAGGTGVSTLSIALAQGLADDTSHGGLVLLADMARNGEQAMLHDTGDVVPGVQELVEAHRGGRATVEETRALTWAVASRRYHLLLGLRRPHSWAAIRPRAFEAAFETLRRSYQAIVCDCDADLEGESDGGSLDVEDRNVMARTAAARADVVLVVGTPGMKGVHSLVRIINDLLAFGVPTSRIVPVFNHAPRHPRSRAELARSVAALVSPSGRDEALSTPVFIPVRRVDDALRDGTRLPAQLVDPLIGAWRAAMNRNSAPRERDAVTPTPVAAGTLGAWSDESAAS